MLQGEALMFHTSACHHLFEPGTQFTNGFTNIIKFHGPLTRYVELLFAHAPGMPGTFSPSLQVSDPDMHHGTCVTHVQWCMPGSLISSFLWSRWRGNIPGACATCNFTYLARGPWKIHFALMYTLSNRSLRHFAHGTIALLSWHVQSYVAIPLPRTELQKLNFPSNLNYDHKIVDETRVDSGRSSTLKKWTRINKILYGALD